jgi:integrase
VLEDAATKWRDDVTNLTWLAQAPWIETNAPHKDREPYPLDIKEQELLFSELAPHLLTMAKFDVETGARDEELCALECAREIPIPELSYRGRPRSVFLVPKHMTKTRTESAAEAARAERRRSRHPRIDSGSAQATRVRVRKSRGTT